MEVVNARRSIFIDVDRPIYFFTDTIPSDLDLEPEKVAKLSGFKKFAAQLGIVPNALRRQVTGVTSASSSSSATQSVDVKTDEPYDIDKAIEEVDALASTSSSSSAKQKPRTITTTTTTTTTTTERKKKKTKKKEAEIESSTSLQNTKPVEVNSVTTLQLPSLMDTPHQYIALVNDGITSIVNLINLLTNESSRAV